jgi:hypothetical protein
MSRREERAIEKTQESVILTPGQARAAIALQFEREEIIRRTNEQIAEIVEAFQEQGRMLALIHQLPRGEGWSYRFDSIDVDGEPRVKLTAVAPPEPAAEPAAEPAEEKQDDE